MKKCLLMAGILVVLGCLVMTLGGCGKKNGKGTVTSSARSHKGQSHPVSGQWAKGGSPSNAGAENGLSEADLTRDGSAQSSQTAFGGMPLEQDLWGPDNSHDSTYSGDSAIGGSQDAGRYTWNEQPTDFQASSNALKDVHFEFDSWRLDQQAKHILEANGDWLRANPDSQVTIEGHCDERGTRAYNFALGQRRAMVTRNYLLALGVSPPQIRITSYGKDKQACSQFTDSCFKANRRAHFVPGIEVVSAQR